VDDYWKKKDHDQAELVSKELIISEARKYIKIRKQ
jgi:hypothetical protein